MGLFSPIGYWLRPWKTEKPSICSVLPASRHQPCPGATDPDLCAGRKERRVNGSLPFCPHLSSSFPPLTSLSLTWMRPTSGSVGAGTRLHPAGIRDSCSFSLPGAVSCHQPFATVQELLGFCPLQGIRDFIAARKEAVRGAWSRWENCP